MKSRILLIFLTLTVFCILFSCDIQKDEEKEYKIPDFAQNQTEFTDEELLNATYSDYKFPLNFYNEDLDDKSLYYVNPISIDSLGSDNYFELSTNSLNQAKYWSIKSTYENSLFEQGIENEKFFEFIRIKNPVDNSVIKFRTHKSSYLTRDNYKYDYLNNSATLGVFSKQKFTENDVKELIDYLWFVRNYNIESYKVLSSFIVNKQLTIEVHHYELFIVGGDFNLYDGITLLKKVYEVDRNSGVIIVTYSSIREINGEFN